MSDHEFYESSGAWLYSAWRFILWALRALGFSAVVVVGCLAWWHFSYTPTCKSASSVLTKNCGERP